MEGPTFGNQENNANLEFKLDAILSKKRFFDAKNSRVYESAKAGLDALSAINEWRARAANSPAKHFYRLFEEFSSLEAEPATSDQKKEMAGLLADRLSFSARSLSPRSYDLHQAILAKIEGKEYEPKFDLTREKIAEIFEDGDIDYLKNPNVAVKSKLSYLSKRFDDYVRGVQALDDLDKSKKGKPEGIFPEKKESDSTPPERKTTSKPSMDEMSRLENNERVKASWSIKPGYGGYYKEQSFDTWNGDSREWEQDEYRYEEFLLPQPGRDREGNIEMSAEILSQAWVNVPIPYTHELSFIIGGINFKFKKDQNGDILVFNSSGQKRNLTVLLAQKETKGGGSAVVPKAFNIKEIFTEETEKVIEEIKKAKQGNRARAFALVRHTHSRLSYSNESKYNAVYNDEPKGYCFAIDTHKKADCDVANTYFATLCARLGIPVRHIVGHMVKGKDENGASAIHSGTGHAWSEIWDEKEKKWIRIDATPPGDPQLEKEDQEKSESVPGDYGEQEAVGPTDEQLAKLEEELAKVVEELSYTPEERKLSEETGITLKDAREIMKEINAAEDTRLKDGRKVTHALSQLFDMIVESRKHFRQEYTGPLRKREGGEHISNVVTHFVGIKSGEVDPLSRSREKNHLHEEKVFGGFDVYIIGDKSGSMSETVEGENKWKIQRRAEYLILSALAQFEEKLKRSGVQSLKDRSLDVQTEAISFRGGRVSDLDTDKPLSDKFESKDKVALWRSLTTQGGGNGDVIALQTIHHKISEEIKSIKEARKEDNRLRIVIAMTDGSPDSVSGVHAMAEALGKLNVVVVGIGLTETAQAVKAIYTTPYSSGDYVKDINDLPALVARHIVSSSLKLFPEKTRIQNERTLKTLLADFNK